MSATGETISFGQDIKPLFRERDRGSMSSRFDRWSYDDVARWSDAILARLRDGSMPCDGAWSEEQVARSRNGSPRRTLPRRRAARTRGAATHVSTGATALPDRPR